MFFNKPRVVISKCLGFVNCYYNGQTFNHEFLKKLKDHVEYIPVCPEESIGLPTPRKPVRLVEEDDRIKLIQPSTGKDLTEKMHNFAKDFLQSLDYVDGFILKERSPSCGYRHVKVYPGPDHSAPHKKGQGLFASTAIEYFPERAVEHEGRLRNQRLREHFLTKLFTLSRFRQVKTEGKIGALVRFQSINKLLFMAYNQKEMRNLGRIAANHDENKAIDELLQDYEKHLAKLMARPPRYTNNINVLMHALGYFSSELKTEEKAFFLDILQKYREERVPLSVPVNVIYSWGLKYNKEYLKEQTFFQPFPEELLDLSDSGKGRKE